MDEVKFLQSGWLPTECQRAIKCIFIKRDYITELTGTEATVEV